MKENYDISITEKDKLILSQNCIIENYDGRIYTLVSDHEKAIKEKVNEIEAQKETIMSCQL